MQSLLKTRRSVGKSTLSERSGLHLGNWVQLDALRIIRTLEGIQMTFDVSGIAARTMLTTISCSMWRATKLHKKETAAARQKHHSDAPRVLVTICNHPALQELASLHQSVYADHRRLSLPSVQDGMRMIPAARHLEHSDMMRRYRSEHDAIVSRFLSDYASEAAAAPARLNGLYDASMWPTQAAIAEKFGLNVRYLSCPTDGAWSEWLSESARAASDELRERLTEALERVRDRCASDGKLYASVFEQLRDVVALVPDLDIVGIPELQAVADAAAPLTILSAEALREDDQARNQTAAKAASILSMLGV
jgi:hypothetical protein